MNTRQALPPARRVRRSILVSTIAPAVLASLGHAADVTWNGPVTLVINPEFDGGLQEGRLNGAFNVTDPNPNTAVTLTPRLAENNAKPPWGDNETWIYSGVVNSGSLGMLSFAENIDDNVQLKIDGVTVLNNTAWDVPTESGVLTFDPNTYHTFELRVGNGAGGAGPVAQNGWAANYGFGLSQTGATGNQGGAYTNPADNGSGSLFAHRIATLGGPDFVGGDTVHVTGDTTVTLQKVTKDNITENSILFENAAATTAFVVNSDVVGESRLLKSLVTNIPDGKTVNVSGSADFNTGVLTVGANSSLVKNGGAGALVLDQTTNSFGAGSTLKVIDGVLSIIGNGNSPISTLSNRIELGQTGGPVTSPVLRIGSVAGGFGTTFNNRLDVKNDATVQHTSPTNDILSGSTIRIASAKTLTLDVTNGSLNLTGIVQFAGLSPGNLQKTGGSTAILSGAAQTLTSINVAGGRLQIDGILSLTNVPTIAPGATLALRNSSGDNSLPAVIPIPSGTLEGVPGAFGDTATALNLTGGRLRLAASGDGLNAKIYNIAPPNVNNSNPNFVDFGTYTNSFNALPAPNISVRTTFGGVTALDYQGAPQYGVYGATFDDNIISRMSGQILVPESGSYTFGTLSDDGSVIFIDGSKVVDNNFFQGRTLRTGNATLTAGVHNIDIGFYEGGGGNSFTAQWAGPSFGTQNLPNSVLFSGTTVTSFNNPIDVQQSSSIDVQTANAVVPTLTIQPGKTLTVTGGTLTAPTVTLNGAGSYGFSGDGIIVATKLQDGGAAVAITKGGTGVLVLDNTTTPQLQNPGSSVTVTGGQVGLLLDSNNPDPTKRRNPLGNASITFAGGGLALSSKSGNQTFALPVFNGDGSVIARKLGSGVAGVTIDLTGSLGIAAGQSVTLGTQDNYTLNVGGTATGAGRVVITGTGVRATTPGALQGLNVDIGAGTPATLVVPVSTTSFGSLASGSGGASLVMGNGTDPATLTLGGGTNARFNGAITEQSGSTLALVKNGTNTQTLGGVNNFTGGVTVNAGTLEIRQNSIGSNTINVAGGTLQFISSGLLGQFFTGDDGGAHNAFGAPDVPANTFTNYNNYFNARTPNLSVSTDSAGVTSLDYQGAPQYGVYGFTQDDNIVSRMSGKIYIPIDGSYTFGTSSDDGSMLYVDGQTVVSNNVYQGRTRRTGSITLTAGLHDIDIGFYEGGGGNNMTADWSGPGFGTQNIPNSVLQNAKTAFDGLATPVNMTASATFDLRNGTVNLGTLTQPAGTTLTATAGMVTFANGILPTAGTYNYVGAGSVGFLQVTDGGSVVTINRSGGGNLVLGTPISPQFQNAGDSLNASGGSLIVAVGSDVPGSNNPLGLASVNVNNGGFAISSSSGDVSFATPVNVTGNATIAAGNFGAGAINGPITATLTSGVTIGSGNTVTVFSNSNYTLALAGAVSGAGSLTATGGTVNALGTFNIGGAITVTGGTLQTANPATAGSVSVTGGTFQATAGVTAAGPISVNGGSLQSLAGVSGSTIAVSNGSLAANGAVTAPGGTTVGAGGTLQLTTSSVTSAINVQGGTVQAIGGVTDLNGGTITVAPVTQTTGALSARVYSGFTNPTGGFDSPTGLTELFSRLPSAKRNLTGDLNFGPHFGADPVFNSFFGMTVADSFIATFSGKFTADVTGTFTFGKSINDDGASIWVDLNRNNVFEPSERIVNNPACCGVSDDVNATENGGVSLVGGQAYKILFTLQDTGGGSSVAAKWGSGAFGAVGGLPQFVSPGSQAGFWSADAANTGGTIRVEAGAELKAGAISNGQAIQLAGGGAKLNLASAAASISSAEELSTASNSGNSEVSLSANNTFNLARALVGGASTLVRTGSGSLTIGLLAMSTGAGLEVNTTAGTTTVNGVVTNGASTITVTDGRLDLIGGNAVGATVTVNDILNIGASQTFDSLTIGDGGVVTLTASAPGAEPDLVEAGAAFSAGGAVQAVPEPGAIGLLAVGMLGLLGRRKARKA